MREIRVFGHAQVTVSVVIRVRDDAELTEKEIFQRARRKFGGIHIYLGNGGDDKLIGVENRNETISAYENPKFDDYAEEV